MATFFSYLGFIQASGSWIRGEGGVATLRSAIMCFGTGARFLRIEGNDVGSSLMSVVF